MLLQWLLWQLESANPSTACVLHILCLSCCFGKPRRQCAQAPNMVTLFPKCPIGDCISAVQVLEFTKYIYEDLSNYDIDSAWPTLIDEFVTHVRCKHSPCAIQRLCVSPTALAHAGLLPTEVAPRPGSKRKLEDAETEDLSKRFASMSPDEPSEASMSQCEERGAAFLGRPQRLHSRASVRINRKPPTIGFTSNLTR
jgi:hypothetical protein